jgi:hypothetical protein
MQLNNVSAMMPVATLDRFFCAEPVLEHAVSEEKKKKFWADTIHG